MKIQSAKKITINKLAHITIFLLVIQYILGMTTNLFVHFPESGTPKDFWEFSQNQIPLAMHIIVGFLLLLGSIWLFIRALISKNNTWLKASTVSLIGIFGAWISGVIFIPSQSDMYSFLMAIGFILSFTALLWGLSRSSRN